MCKKKIPRLYNVFTLPSTETDTEVDKKMGCIKLCGIFIMHRYRHQQRFPIRFCANLWVSVSVSVFVSVLVSGRVNAPLDPAGLVDAKIEITTYLLRRRATF